METLRSQSEIEDLKHQLCGDFWQRDWAKRQIPLKILPTIELNDPLQFRHGLSAKLNVGRQSSKLKWMCTLIQDKSRYHTIPVVVSSKYEVRLDLHVLTLKQSVQSLDS